MKEANQGSTRSALAKRIGLSRSMRYYRHKKPIKDWLLKTEIEKILRKHPGYGRPRLADVLKINHKRIGRVMKLFGIKAYRRRGKRFRKTKDFSSLYPNLLHKVIPARPNKVWVSDFTHLDYGRTRIYLATVMDVFDRRIVGFSLSTHHDVYLVINALMSALNQRLPPEIIHSDQGSEYTSRLYRNLVKELGVKMSLSPKASPWENGYQESFYNQFKIDLGDPERFENVGELMAEIYRTLHVYNTERIHTALKMPPQKFYENYLLKNINNSPHLLSHKMS